MSSFVLVVLGAASSSCVIPDKGIVIEVASPCGEEWIVQTVGAYGYNGIDEQKDILTEGDEWLSRHYCVNQAQHAELSDVQSALAANIVSGIIADCQARAIELGYADHDDSCTTTANLAWVGACSSPDGGCDDPPGADDEADDETDDETDEGTDTDAETGADTETDADPSEAGETDSGAGWASLSDLDLNGEVSVDQGVTVVSSLLIATALDDLPGLTKDTTRATLVVDNHGVGLGFDLSGVQADNLGGALGFEDGDRVVSVAGWPTKAYADLSIVLALLLDSDRADVELVRDGAQTTLRFRRGPSGPSGP